jgi:hypothetical protein
VFRGFFCGSWETELVFRGRHIQDDPKVKQPIREGYYICEKTLKIGKQATVLY